MSELPKDIPETLLWHRMDSEPDLQQSLRDLRQTAGAIGAQAARLLPSYTDHSVKHFDALWQVSSQILTREEIENISAGEAFVLGSSFYIHDLGMAFAATQEGKEILLASDAYETVVRRLESNTKLHVDQIKEIALQTAARELHAAKARELVLQPLPGLGRYLIESTGIRDQWATYIADVSASHHWSLAEIDDRLGRRGRFPDPSGGEIDLAYVACALRIIDYAHINFERASNLDRLLRSDVDPSSVVHWDAQAHITGPHRYGDSLVFG